MKTMLLEIHGLSSFHTSQRSAPLTYIFLNNQESQSSPSIVGFLDSKAECWKESLFGRPSS